MPDKLLTIITVTKNCVSTIERTLQSVELSKPDGVEYIVVDGVSDDGTLEIINKHKDVIDLFICEPDSGIYQAMNKGVAKARGRFILFINGGDELVPAGVKEVLSILGTCHEQIVCATTLVIGGPVTSALSYIPAPQRLVYGDSLPHPSSFINRELISRFPFREDLKIASDFDFFLRTFLAGVAIRIVPCQSALHYLGGLSSDHTRRKSEVNAILRIHLGWKRMYYYKFYNVFLWGKKKISSWLGDKGCI